ncbi:MAG: protein kinase [Chloroflexi bacterium]|nr:protein kinase [Chloroflexota bacterium]
MSVWIGKTLGKIKIEKLLGRGGMAEVYFGRHATLTRPVAVKIMHGYLDGEGDLSTRFTREARVAAGLRHPNIVQVYDFDVYEGQPYIVMEYINGPSLSVYLRSLHERGGRMPLRVIRRLFPLLASALDYAHSQGLVHRDIKPGNILLQSRTRPIELGAELPADVEPLLADFGLVRVLDAPNQTSSGLITGTPAYMSPEQARGRTTDHRTDVYSLGVLLYELLSGSLPFDGDTALIVIQKIIHEPPAPLANVSPEIQAVMERALEKDASKRYQSAGELSNAFLAALGFVSEANTLPPMTLPELRELRTTPPVAISTPPANPPRRARWVLPALGFVALTLIALAAIFFKPAPTAETISTATMDRAAPTSASATEAPVATRPPTVGVMRFQDVAAALDGVTVKVSGMPFPAQGSHYEVWLTLGETRRSLGVLELDANGDGALSFVDAQSRNLLGRFDTMEVTVEPSPDPSPNSSGRVAFSSGIVSDSLSHVRHLLVSISDTPNQVGLVHGMMTDARLVDEYANAMLTSFDAGDDAAMRANAEAVVNLIVGGQSDMYADHDGDGALNDPGDGYGFLLNGDSPGYTGGVYSHTQYAMQVTGAPATVQLHGLHVMVSVENVEHWSVGLRDLVLSVLQNPSDDSARATLVKIVALADQIVSGVDLDGNEHVDPIAGEGGALTVFEHAYYMADMEILFGANQLMPSGPPMEFTPKPYNESG